jgi:hypothetical protein
LKPCGICGLPVDGRRKYHADCDRALEALVRKMRCKQGDFSEIRWRFDEMKAHGEWLLNQRPHAKVQKAIGEGGEEAVLIFRIYLRRSRDE